MFSWICPKCGSDVPPSYSECPNCAADESARAAIDAPEPADNGLSGVVAAPLYPDPAPLTRPPVPPPKTAPAVRKASGTSYEEPSTAPPTVPPAAAPIPTPPPPPTYQVAGRQGTPGWPIILFVVLVAGAAGAFYLFRASQANRTPSGQIAQNQGASPAGAANTAARPHPLQNHVEVAGFRIRETKDTRLELQFVLINHSAMRIEGLGGNLRLQTHSKDGQAAPFVSFPFTAGTLEPYAIKELKTTLRTNLRAYELPDWQFVDAKLEITSP